MMDVVLGGAAGLILAVLMSNPPREKAKPVTAVVVTPEPKVADKATNKKRK